MVAARYILEFNKIDKGDIVLVGGKGANLGEMTQEGFPVPKGFAVTVAAYEFFLDSNDLKEKIKKILAEKDAESPEGLNDTSKKIQKLITSSKIPIEVSKSIVKSYKKLSGPLNALVAARSSATAEDLPSASFAGQQASFMNVQGEANLLLKVRECWASLFTPRAIFYREENRIAHEKVKISVIIQKMVQSEASGVMFTIDPVSDAKDRIIIEAIWGLGDAIVQGIVVPDRYIVQKETFALLSKEISDQKVMLVKDKAGTKQVPVKTRLIGVQKISDKEIIKLAKIGDKIQKHYYFPQDIEWAKEKNNLYITQSRPVTTIGGAKKIQKQQLLDGEIASATTPILTGSPASPGIGTGYVKILKSPKEISRIKEGDVLVTKMTSPDFVPAMKKASAIVTDEGGSTSHAAIVSRELGIPCIVGTKEATKILKEGQVVSVNGSTGMVYIGSKVTKEEVTKVEEKPIHQKTRTNLYVNLAEKERAREVSKLFVDGVGLLRAEFMIANIGIHPKEAIKQKKQMKFIDSLALDIATFARAFYPRPVVYRATDFKTNEYRQLPGGKAWEPEEPNPLLGFRGALRYISDPEVFNLELTAIKKVRANYDNLWMMIPFVRSPQELAKVRRLIAAEGLLEQDSFKLWMMVELPVNVILLDEFIKVGIDGVSVGSNDLTMLLQGSDRDNSAVASSFNEKSEEVMWALKRVIKTCNKYGVTSSICGQAPSVYDDLVSDLVKLGITSLSVNPDAINRVRRVIMETEKKIE